MTLSCQGSPELLFTENESNAYRLWGRPNASPYVKDSFHHYVIDDRRDRLTTIMVAPLMTCSARIPVYTLIISAFIPDKTVWGFANLQGLVMFGLYAAGIISTLAVALVIRRFWVKRLVPSHGSTSA